MADVTTTFGAKDVGFNSTVNRMQRTLAGFQSGIAGFGIKMAGLAATFVGVQQSIAAFRSGLDMAGRLNDLSKTTGEAAGNLAMLERAFQNNGMSAEQVGVSIAKMSEFIVNLQSGSEAATKAANAMGISMADLANKSPVERMEVLMRAIAGIADPALRTATAVDVFGRSGRAVIPLATEFSGEMANARAELGSLIPILNESGASLDELGDKLTNSVGNKLTELAVGFAAGVTGANNFVDALSKIDAAGLGQDIGEALRVAFDAPHEVAKAIGHTLLGGVKDAGNHLLAFIERARDAYYNMLQNPGFYSGLQKFLEGTFAQVGKVFTTAIIDGINAAMSLMDWNPLWKPLINIAKDQLKNIQGDIAIAGEAAANQMEHGATQMKAAFNAGARETQLIVKDSLGAQQHYEQAATHLMTANEQSRQVRENAEHTESSFRRSSEALTKAYEDIRGFDLKGQMGPEARPDWTKSNNPPPVNASARIASDEANARALHGPRGGGTLPTKNERIGGLRGSPSQQRADQRAQELADRGMFYSSIAAQDRGRRRADEKMDSARTRDMAAQFDFAGRSAGNAGEGMKSLTDEMGRMNFLDKLRGAEGFDPTKGEVDNFKNALNRGVFDAQRDFERDANGKMSRMADEQAKTPEQRKREDEAARARGAAPGGGRADSQPDSLSAILTHVASIDEKLPLNAMSNQ